MTFWMNLRRAGTLIFLVIVLVSWFAAHTTSTQVKKSELSTRPAPVIVR